MTDNARRLVARVRALIEEHERKTKPRKYVRGEAMAAKFERAIGAFLSDLLRADRGSQGWVSRSLRNASFPPQGDFSWKTAEHVVDGLRALHLMEVALGYRKLGPRAQHGSRVAIIRDIPSKLRALPALIELAADCGVPLERASLHFSPGPPKDPVVVRGTAAWDGYTKIKGSLIRDKLVPERITAEVLEINRFLRDFTLEGGSHGGFFRGFNNGDNAEFKFDMGGRLYSAGPENYQSMKPAERLRMCISGQPVVEVDVRASFLTIAYALHRLPLAGDPYVLDALGEEARAAVKMFVTASLGSGSPIERWSRKHKARYHEDTGESLDRWPIGLVSTHALQRHPFLRTAGQRSASGVLVGWPALMWIESEAIVATMLDLLRNYGIASYPVHDSLLVPAIHAPRTVKQLGAHYLGKLLDHHSEALPPEVRVHCAEDSND